MAKKLEGCTFETLDGYRVTITYFLKSINKDITKITTQDVRNFMMDYQTTRNDCEDALFISQNKPYKRLTRGGVEFIVKTIGEIAEVEDCHPHRFRRTLATRLIDIGVPNRAGTTTPWSH